MAAARKVGMKLGRGAGWVGATLWKGTVIVATAAGDAGEGFLEGAETGWDERCAVMDAGIEKRRIEREAKFAAFKAYKAAKDAKEAAAPMQAA